jgi:ubiquitin C-terminal hydrolase
MCFELTRFFLDGRFQFINKLETKNTLGTEGRLVMAYAKLINEMWNLDSMSVAPQLFKRILGEYATQFAGFGQHDSHECINTILDLMGEDLYRKGKKPYVETSEAENQPEEEAAAEAWNKHLLRNESIIHDLFHG